jgi:hypothetical protein
MFEALSPHGVVAAALIAPPGPECLSALAAVDPWGLNESARVDLLIAWERQHSWLAARLQPVLAAAGDAAEAAARVEQDAHGSADLALRAAHGEIGAALRLAESTAASKLATARTLTVELPAVRVALLAGDISIWHANAIVEITSVLSMDKARAAAGRVLPRAGRQTVAQLRRCLHRAVLAADPDAAAERVRKAHADRTLQWWPLADGMAELRLIASAAEVMAVYQAADAVAQQLKAAGPKVGTEGWLPVAALRADALVHLAAGCAKPPPPAAVNITIDLPTLLGLQNNPGELAGYGPLPAPLARTLAADGRWRRLICDPQTGALIDLGHTSYKPSAELTRYVKTRDRTCIFPTCNRTAARCDLDHRRPYRPDDPGGGRTDRNNLHPACGNHHKLKHKAGWTLRTSTTTDECTWTSPTGKQYPVQPQDHRSPAEPCPF